MLLGTCPAADSFPFLPEHLVLACGVGAFATPDDRDTFGVDVLVHASAAFHTSCPILRRRCSAEGCRTLRLAVPAVVAVAEGKWQTEACRLGQGPEEAEVADETGIEVVASAEIPDTSAEPSVAGAVPETTYSEHIGGAHSDGFHPLLAPGFQAVATMTRLEEDFWLSVAVLFQPDVPQRHSRAGSGGRPYVSKLLPLVVWFLLSARRNVIRTSAFAPSARSPLTHHLQFERK